MQRRREHLITAILFVVYLLASVRFFPGRPVQTLVETLTHLLAVAPISLGATLVLVALLQRLIGERLPLSRGIRIFLVIALCLEFILGLSHYYAVNGAT